MVDYHVCFIVIVDIISFYLIKIKAWFGLLIIFIDHVFSTIPCGGDDKRRNHCRHQLRNNTGSSYFNYGIYRSFLGMGSPDSFYRYVPESGRFISCVKTVI